MLANNKNDVILIIFFEVKLMQKKRRLVIFIIVLSLTSIIYTFSYFSSVQALSRYGSRGSEVVQIQTRLKSWGYYGGAIDGIYGTKTVNAVKWFQSKSGLLADGIAGPLTLAKIGLPTGSSSAPGSRDVNLLAHLITGEARGEPYIGMVAVGAVVLNRTHDSRFPNTVAGVIYQPGAFSVVNDGQINLPVDQQCLRAAQDAYNGWDPTNGAVYYYNPARTTNKWIYSRPVVARIGDHVFAR
jgi:N-acetylmuramoyl-L-alanine amidase